jgi:hypothetical protein
VVRFAGDLLFSSLRGAKRLCTLYAPCLTTQSGTDAYFFIREIDEDLYLAVLQAAKQAQSAA